MRISIITVTYNSAATIRDTLESVAGQTYSDIEHIIVDGGSTDETLNIVRSQGRSVARLISEPDQGIYDAMNKGWRAASGEVVGFLNSDDFLASPDSVALIAAAFAKSDVDACYGDVVYVSRTDPSRVVRYWRSKPFVSGDFLKGWQPPHPTFYVRRAVIERNGGFDLSYSISSDFDFCLRVLEIGRARSHYIPQVLVRMRTGGVSNGTLRNIVKNNVEAYRACRRNGLSVGPAFFVHKIASKIPQIIVRPQANDTDGDRVSEVARRLWLGGRAPAPAPSHRSGSGRGR